MKKQFELLINRITTTLFTLIIIFGAIVFFAPYHWILNLSVHYIPHFVIASLVCAVLFVVQKRFRFGFATLFLCVAFSTQLIPLYVPLASAEGKLSGESVNLTLMQVNINYKNYNTEALLNLIMRTTPDIIVIEEIQPQVMRLLRGSIGSMYPYILDASVGGFQGMALFSNRPLEIAETVTIEDETPPLIIAKLQNLDVIIIGVHTLSPINKSWSEKRDVVIDRLGALAASVPGPVILVGDFNTTIHDPHFRDMMSFADLTDARRGLGWKPTWLRQTILAAAIDHVLYRGDMAVHEFQVLEDVGSDHRPVAVELEIMINKE